MTPRTTDDDLACLLDHLPATVLFFDGALELQRLVGTAATSAIAPGTPIAVVGTQLNDPQLPAEALQTLQTGHPSQTRGIDVEPGRRFIRRITASRPTEPSAGVCVSYLDAAACTTAVDAATRRRAASQQAHDLRSPLGAITMWAKLLRTRSMSPTEINNGLDAIIRSAEQQQQVIERYLKEP